MPLSEPNSNPAAPQNGSSRLRYSKHNNTFTVIYYFRFLFEILPLCRLPPIDIVARSRPRTSNCLVLELMNCEKGLCCRSLFNDFVM